MQVACQSGISVMPRSRELALRRCIFRREAGARRGGEGGAAGVGGRSDSPTVSFPRRTKKKSVRVSLQWNAIFVFYETTDEYQGRLKLVFCFGGLLQARLLGGLLVPAPTPPFRPPPTPHPFCLLCNPHSLPSPAPSRTHFPSTRFVCVYRTTS